MYSDFVDQLVSKSDDVIQHCLDIIKPLAADICEALKCPGEETPKPYTVDYSSISSDMGAMSAGLGQAKSIGDGIYCGKNSYNTSSGSPWTEMDRLNEEMSFVAGSPTSLQFIGEKVSALAHLNALMSLAVDAKNVVIEYHDSLARGYDNQFNDNKPSVTWKDSVKGGTTMGNIGGQTGANNVNIPPEPIDPY